MALALGLVSTSPKLVSGMPRRLLLQPCIDQALQHVDGHAVGGHDIHIVYPIYYERFQWNITKDVRCLAANCPSLRVMKTPLRFTPMSYL